MYGTDLEFGLCIENWVYVGDMFEAYVEETRQHMQGITNENCYLGSPRSAACWHPEDGDFAALNYHQWGARKVGFLTETII